MFKKVLVANRGEIAVRIIRACHDLGIEAVAIHSQADKDSLHVELADEAVCVGPDKSSGSYLNQPNILMACVITGAEAIHPGYGYLAENPGFAEKCELIGIKFIGPSHEVITKMGEKSNARRMMKRAHVPVIPGTEEILPDVQTALVEAGKIGYPVLIKAANGGGGKGIREVNDSSEMMHAFNTAQSESLAAFGSPDVYLEKKIIEPRHIEVQILADRHGNVIHLGERECSIQNQRHQKALEESPSVALSEGQRNKIGAAAVRAAKVVGYENAGTIEFLLDARGEFYFMEMNTRVQVEHPVTEMITGVDIVKEQIRIAAGERLSLNQKNLKIHGHAIECRITAEDPDNNFRPAIGRVGRLVIPGGIGVRVDTHLYPGYEIPMYYDSLLAKVIVWAETRPEAILKMERCLQEFQAEGIKTNIPFQLRILRDPLFRAGKFSTSFITELLKK